MRTPIANSSDFPAISILFEDPSITFLFAELLEVHGLRTEILVDLSESSGNTKIVTEPQFYSKLSPRARTQCLVVGNKDSLKGIDAITLSRPLTEAKIEQAIREFVSSD